VSLEGGGDGEAEGLAGFAQDIEAVVELFGHGVGVVARAAGREHAAGDEVLAGESVEELEGIDGVVDAERCVDDGHHDVELAAGGIAGNIVGAGNGIDGGAEFDLLTALAGAVDVVGAAVEGRIEGVDAFGTLAELAVAEGHIHGEVVEDVKADGAPVDGDHVLEVGGEAGVAADGGNAVDGQRDLNGSEAGVGGIARNDGAVGIGESKHHAGGDESVGGDGADVEAANIGFATGGGTVKGRSHIAAETGDVDGLQAHAKRVTSGGIEPEALDRGEALIFDDRAHVAHAAPNACELHGGGEGLAGVRQVVAVDVAGVIAEHCRAGDDAFEGVLALDSAAEGEGLEEIAGGLAESADRRAVPGIGRADAGEAEEAEAAERIAAGEGEAFRSLVVILQQGGDGGVLVGAAGERIALGCVVIGFAVEDLEADIEGLVAEIGLVEGEEQIARETAGVGLDTEGFAESEEVVGLIIEAEEGAGETADAAVESDGVLAFFLDLEKQIDGACFSVLVGLGVLLDACLLYTSRCV